MADFNLKRLSSFKSILENDYGIDVSLYANEDVPLDRASLNDIDKLLSVQKKVKELSKSGCGIEKVVLTPDYHRGSKIPVGTVIKTKGFVLPQAIGNDVNCGMRLNLTSLKIDDIEGDLDQIEKRLRHIFFEGGRNIPMTGIQREAIFRNGIKGLLETSRDTKDGIFDLFHGLNMEDDLKRISSNGSLKADSIYGLKEFCGPSHHTRDGQTGSIGGGNHFVEIQYVKEILDSKTAYDWGLKKGMILIMVHSGSLSIGHMCGNHFLKLLSDSYPDGVKHPESGIYPLIVDDENMESFKAFRDSLYNAGNFAFVNRLFLSLMVLKALGDDIDASVLYDAPHNFVWEMEENAFIHRKGACPARGMIDMSGTPYEYYGEPVIVPGSMGASSFLLKGEGNSDSLSSASHGAGRVLSRGKALKHSEAEFKKFMEEFRVITPVDLKRDDIRLRKDIVKKKLDEIKQEAPFAYKGITPVVETLCDGRIASKVAELTPVMTVKG